MTFPPQSGNKNAHENGGSSTPANRKVYRSKMTDAYAIDEIGEEKQAVEAEEYFEDGAIYLLSEINLLFDKLIHSYYTVHGLTHVQIPILMTLLKEGSMTVSQLGRSLEIGSSNITPLCKRLEAMGLVTRNRDHYDQRVVFVTITDYAKELLININRDIRAQTKDEVSPLSSDDQDQVYKGMLIFRNYLADIMTSTEKRKQVNQAYDKRVSRLEAAQAATELSEIQRESKRRGRPKSKINESDED